MPTFWPLAVTIFLMNSSYRRRWGQLHRIEWHWEHHQTLDAKRIEYRRNQCYYRKGEDILNFSNANFFWKSEIVLCVLNICRFCWRLISTMTRSYLWMNFKLWWPRVQISCRLFTSQYKSQLPICYAWKLYPPKNLEESLLSPWSDHFWFGMIMIQPYLRGCHAMSEK